MTKIRDITKAANIATAYYVGDTSRFSRKPRPTIDLRFIEAEGGVIAQYVPGMLMANRVYFNHEGQRWSVPASLYGHDLRNEGAARAGDI